jgi:hypothetical protein
MKYALLLSALSAATLFLACGEQPTISNPAQPAVTSTEQPKVPISSQPPATGPIQPSEPDTIRNSELYESNVWRYKYYYHYQPGVYYNGIRIIHGNYQGNGIISFVAIDSGILEYSLDTTATTAIFDTCHATWNLYTGVSSDNVCARFQGVYSYYPGMKLSTASIKYNQKIYQCMEGNACWYVEHIGLVHHRAIGPGGNTIEETLISFNGLDVTWIPPTTGVKLLPL